MIKFLHLCIVVFISITISCSDDSSSSVTSADKLSEVEGEEFSVTQVETGLTSFVNDDDDLTFTFEATLGNSYEIVLDQSNDLDYYNELAMEVSTPSGTDINQKSFVAKENGTYTVVVSLSNGLEAEPDQCTFSYSILEAPSTKGKYDGNWLLTEIHTEAFGKAHTKSFTATNAQSYFEIKNDSLFEYYFDSYGDSIGSHAELLMSSYIASMNVEVTIDKLILLYSHEYGTASRTYSKYTGDWKELLWDEQDFEVSNDLIGTWYLASEEYESYECEDGDMEEFSIEETYDSGENSYKIISITKDSIAYYRYLSGSIIDEYVLSNNKDYNFLKDIEKNDDMLVHEYLEVLLEDGEEIATYGKDIYKKYDGELPPVEWNKGN